VEAALWTALEVLEERGEALERILERDQIDLGRLGGELDETQRHALATARALGGAAVAGVVHEDAAHHVRGDADELRAVPPIDATLVDEPEVGFVHERCGLERVTAALFAEEVGGEAAQFAVNQRHQLLERVLIAVFPVDQKLRYAFRRLHMFGISARVYNKCFEPVREYGPNIRVNRCREEVLLHTEV
jgi:hypothetical protein